jgi:hypothetical protein
VDGEVQDVQFILKPWIPWENGDSTAIETMDDQG